MPWAEEWVFGDRFARERDLPRWRLIDLDWRSPWVNIKDCLLTAGESDEACC